MRTAKDKKLSVPVRAIHIDLKGMPPKMERLLQLLELYAASSYNAVLVEWEDMFPWQEPLLRSPYAYSKEEINAFVETEYWTIDANLLKGKKKIVAKFHGVNGKKTNLENENQASEIVKNVENEKFVVTSIKNTKKKKQIFS